MSQCDDECGSVGNDDIVVIIKYAVLKCTSAIFTACIVEKNVMRPEYLYTNFKMYEFED